MACSDGCPSSTECVASATGTECTAEIAYCICCKIDSTTGANADYLNVYDDGYYLNANTCSPCSTHSADCNTDGCLACSND